MSFVTDPFDAMALGPGVPPGWTISGGGNVRGFSDGGIWASHNWFDYAGNGLTTPHFGPTRSFSAFFAYNINSIFTGTTLFELFANDLSLPPIQRRLLRLTQEKDCSLSIYITGLSTGNDILIGNSGSLIGYGFQLNEWFYIQLNVQLTNQLVGPFWFFNYSVSMLVDSNLVISGGGVGLPDPEFLNGGLLGSGIEFGQFLGGRLGISQVEFLTLQANNHFPDAGRNPFQRISQLPIEISSLVSSGQVRVSQLPIEIIEGKTSAKVRISQLPIELMRKASTQAGGWIVSEA